MNCNNDKITATGDKEQQQEEDPEYSNCEEPFHKKLRLENSEMHENSEPIDEVTLTASANEKHSYASSNQSAEIAISPGEVTSTKLDETKPESSAVDDEVKESEEDVESYTLAELGKIWEEEEALLGGCSKTECSHKLGSVPRQALYICTTCSENGKRRAGICFACARQCHDGHELIEIYTKRNFRCDCGNSLFPGACKLESSKAEINPGNIYDQTFEGLYCKCKRPYPDESPDACNSVMVQCIVCEDWYHLEHLKCGPQGVPDSDAEFAEIICDLCMSGNARVLAGYHNKLGAFCGNTEDLKEDDECKEGSPCCKPQAVEISNNDNCKNEDDAEPNFAVATFWKFKWRNHLCKCSDCLNTYQFNDIAFITDWDDSLCEYERKGREAAQSEEDQFDKKVEKMGHYEKFVVSRAMGMLEHELKAFLSSEGMSDKQVITEKDMRLFTEKWKKKVESQKKDLLMNFPPSNCHAPNF